MKLSLKVGTTSKTINIFIRDSSSTTGGGLTGLVFNTASLTCYYALPRAAPVAVTLATLAAVTSAYSSGGFIAIDGTNMPGWYRFDIPDAALASGAFCNLHFKGATNMAPLPIEIELTAVDNQSATAFMTSVATAVNVTTVNGLAANVITAAATAADFGAEIADAVWDEDATAHQTQGTFGQAIGDPGADTDTIFGLVNTNLDAAVSSRLSSAGYTAPDNASIAAILTDTAEIGVAGAGLTNINLPDQTMNITGDITGNLSGSVGSVTGAVGSVTGAVGSVTGNVGGNVVGSVASVTAGVTLAANAITAAATAADFTTEIQAGLATAAALATVDTNVSAILVDTAEIGAAGAGLTALASQTSVNDLPTNAELATALDALPTAAENATAVLTTAMTESYRADGATGTLAQMQYEIIGHLGESSIVSTTKTIKKVDGTTTAATFTLDSDTAPTSITRAT